MTEPEQIDYFPPTGYYEFTEKIQNFSKGLTDLLKNNPDSRLISIVWQIGFEHYVEGILMGKLDSMKTAQYLRYNEQIDVLVELGLINRDLAKDLNNFKEIRNIYAHIVNIDEKRINQLLDSMNSFSRDDQEFSDKSRHIRTLCSKIEKQLEEIYQEVFSEKFDVGT